MFLDSLTFFRLRPIIAYFIANSNKALGYHQPLLNAQINANPKQKSLNRMVVRFGMNILSCRFFFNLITNLVNKTAWNNGIILSGGFRRNEFRKSTGFTIILD
jgi:hypothetical protein